MNTKSYLAVILWALLVGVTVAQATGVELIGSPTTGTSETFTPGPLKVGASGISTDGGLSIASATGANGMRLTASSSDLTFTRIDNASSEVSLGSPGGLSVYFNTTGTRRIHDNGTNISVNGTLTSESGSGTDAFAASNGARFHIGTGASDYLTSNGTTITAASALSASQFSSTIASGGSTAFQSVTNTYWLLNTGGGAGFIAPSNGTTAAFEGTLLTAAGLGLGATHVVGNMAWSATAPTIGAGWGSSPSIVASNGTAAFQINVGTGGVATNGSITLPAATTGWSCTCEDVTTISTTVARCRQTGLGSTTSVNIGNYTSTDIAGAWVASDKILVNCVAY